MKQDKIYYVCMRCDHKHWIEPVGGCSKVTAVHPCVKCGYTIHFDTENIAAMSLQDKKND